MLYAGVVFYLILQFLRPQEFLPLIRGARLVFYSMILLTPPWLATLQFKKVFRTPQDYFMLLFCVICALSYLNWWPTRIQEPAEEMGKTLLCYLFVVHVIDTRRKLVGALWLVMMMLLIVALMAHEIQIGPTRGQYASIGMFDNRNDFAYALAMMLPVAFAFVLRGDPFAKICGAGVLLAGMAELVATDSRGGQLASMFAAYSTIFVLARSKVGRGVLLVVGVVVLMFAFAFSARLGTIGSYQQDESAMDRVYIWSNALEMFKDHPLIGVGWKKFREYSKRDSHSSYMRAIAELGGVGLALYLGMLFFALRDAHNLARNAPHPSLRMAGLALTGVLVGHLVASLFQTRLYHTFVLVQIAIVSALRLVSDRERAAERATQGSGAPTAVPAPVPAASAGPGAAAPEPPNLWERSVGFGLKSPGLITRLDLLRIGGLTFACWLVHKIFIMKSG